MLVKWALVFFKPARACFGLEMLYLVVKTHFTGQLVSTFLPTL